MSIQVTQQRTTLSVVLVEDYDLENADEIEVSVPVRTGDLVTDHEILLHIEDEIKVNAIRGGRLVEVYWNALTDHERQAAREAFLSSFEPCCY